MSDVDKRSHLQQSCDNPYRFGSESFFISGFKSSRVIQNELKINTAAVEKSWRVFESSSENSFKNQCLGDIVLD